MNAAVVISSVGNRVGLVLYASLTMGYYIYARGLDGTRRREIQWQLTWLLAVLLLTALSGSVHDTLMARQLETSLLYEVILRINKVVPRVLWFPVLAHLCGIRIKRADALLMAAYGLVMLVTPRMSNLASLIWGVPFLWGAVRLETREPEHMKKLKIFLLLCFSLHVANAVFNISGFGGANGGSTANMMLRLLITSVCYPAVFATDLTARFLAWRDGSQTAETAKAAQDAAPAPLPAQENVPAEPALAQVIEGMADSYGLTPRETEIVQYIYEGMTNREIAERIYTAEGTVKAHNYNIYSKMGITKRTQLILAVNEAREKRVS